MLASLSLGEMKTAPESNTDISQALDRICKKYCIPAMAGAFFPTSGLERAGAAGVRRTDVNTPVTALDPWHLGSNTKAMTATLAGTFVAEGKLFWDDKVASFFPWLDIHPALQDVTVRQLLSHQAGLAENLYWVGLLSSNGNLPAERALVAEMALTAAPVYPPGTFHYSNTGYIVVGAILERIGGKSWEDLVRERLFKPLGMKTGGFGGTGTPGELDQPWGHWSNGKPVRNNGPGADNNLVMGQAGTLYVSVEDYRFDPTGTCHPVETQWIPALFARFAFPDRSRGRHDPGT